MKIINRQGAGPQACKGASLKKRVGPPVSRQAPKPSSKAKQSSSPQAKGSSWRPKSTSSRILEPGYKRTSSGWARPVFRFLFFVEPGSEPGSGFWDRATRTNEFFG